VIRPFDWRDLGLLTRVRHRGLCLDSQLAFTRGTNALHNALLDPFTPGQTICTLVARAKPEEGGAAVGQLLLLENHSLARLAFMGPPEALEKPVGKRLLDALTRFAGQHGAQSLTAEVNEQDPAFESLRLASFAIYARQRLWRLDEAPRGARPRAALGPWRREKVGDRSAIQSLFQNLVPALVQQVEPPPGRDGQGLVYCSQGEVLGYLDIHRGPAGTWVLPYLHPAAEIHEELLAGILQELAPSQARPLYICVRSYQGGLAAALEALGFRPHLDQAVMVKRLSVPVRQAIHKPLPALEGTQPEATAPIIYNSCEDSSLG